MCVHAFARPSSQLPRQVDRLRELSITHVLNMAHRQAYADTPRNRRVFDDAKCVYMGIEAYDTRNYRIDKHFDETNRFIADALNATGEWSVIWALVKAFGFWIKSTVHT
jgi:hypothetical protein